MNSYSNSSSFGSADWLMSAVKKHPEGLLLLAAGCALLLRSGSASAQGSQGSGQYQRYSGSQTGYGGGGIGECERECAGLRTPRVNTHPMLARP